jgi:RNA polymerase sigma-70 factor, ECF subfamily
VITPPSADDSRLALEARAGSQAAFGVLVSRYHRSVFGFLLALTRHRQDAEDLTQETFLRAWDKLHHYDPSRPLLPWLLTIGRRLSIAALRAKPRPLPPEAILPQETESVQPTLWLWEIARRQLAPDSFAALWLHYHDELPLREVAAVLGKREGAVKVILHRARKSLAAHFHQRPPVDDIAFSQAHPPVP